MHRFISRFQINLVICNVKKSSKKQNNNVSRSSCAMGDMLMTTSNDSLRSPNANVIKLSCCSLELPQGGPSEISPNRARNSTLVWPCRCPRLNFSWKICRIHPKITKSACTGCIYPCISIPTAIWFSPGPILTNLLNIVLQRLFSYRISKANAAWKFIVHNTPDFLH